MEKSIMSAYFNVSAYMAVSEMYGLIRAFLLFCNNVTHTDKAFFHSLLGKCG